MDIPGGLHGAVLQRELIGAIGRYPVRAALRDGALLRLWDRVLVDTERVADPRTRASAALLLHGPDAVLSGPTGAWLHGCQSIDEANIHVLLPYGHPGRRRPGLIVHNGSTADDDVVELDGLRSLGAIRVTSDLLCTARPRDALAIADQMLAAQPAEWREEFRGQVARRISRRADPRGTRRGARLLGLATGRAESPPESWLMLEVAELGFPPPEANWSLRSPSGAEVYRLDLAWPEQRIAVEYQGYAVHVERQAEDLARLEDLRRRGWIVILVAHDDLKNNRRLAAALREAFERRGFPRQAC
ncbi:hypothetical protein [Pseudonocardia spinosispora]|uniref:hypothetical protein n=1 Tax=Pseudonocardia spinosispora TaxID=103441 RepID=UPI00040286D0|nr:hypothetical protein [Pseudonocardia spinosispora]